MARLDQLGPAKYVAQLASTIGREFDYPLLEAISSLPPVALRQGLQRAPARGARLRRDHPPSGESYAFKHALLQEAAYQTLLRNRRHELHTRIAEALEQQFPQITQDAPELVAHHWTAAGNATRASRTGSPRDDVPARAPSISKRLVTCAVASNSSP